MSTEKEKAIETIREIQAEWASSLNPKYIASDIRSAALNAQKQLEIESRNDGDYIHSGPFKYPSKSELRRWRHTNEVIERVEPGPRENPIYLAILARQLASIEMILRRELTPSPNERMVSVTDRVLLATTPEPFVDAYSKSKQVSAHKDYVLVFLSSGLIQFLYQAAKAVVLSWKPLPPPPGRTSSFSAKMKDTEAVLAKNPYPIDLLLGTLESYFFDGFPRDPKSKLPSIDYFAPLESLITFSERSVIAHEYGHALLHHKLGKDLEFPFPTATATAWDKEYQADVFSFYMVLESAGFLDCFPPNIALQGSLFALHAIEVLRRAMDIIRSGKVTVDKGFDTHPPTKLRIEQLKNIYRANYEPKDDEPPLGLNGALVPSETLLLLWKRALPKLKARRGTAPLHPIWGK